MIFRIRVLVPTRKEMFSSFNLLSKKPPELKVGHGTFRFSPEFDVTVFLVILGVADQTPSVDRRYNGLQISSEVEGRHTSQSRTRREVQP